MKKTHSNERVFFCALKTELNGGLLFRNVKIKE